MILHRAFREEPLDAAPDTRFSEAEERYLAQAAHPQGSRAARALAKALVVEWLTAQGLACPPEAIEILPAVDGPPELRLPEGMVSVECRAHVSLSHSRTHIAALLVVEALREDADVGV